MKVNYCPNCRHCLRSRAHFLKCKGGTLRQWHAANTRGASRPYTPRRSAAEIFAGQNSVNEIEPVEANGPHSGVEALIAAAVFAQAGAV